MILKLTPRVWFDLLIVFVESEYLWNTELDEHLCNGLPVQNVDEYHVNVEWLAVP